MTWVFLGQTLWWGRVLDGFQVMAFLYSRTCFAPHLKEIVAEVKASELSHIIRLLFLASNGMLHVMYCSSNNSCFCESQISWR